MRISCVVVHSEFLEPAKELLLSETDSLDAGSRVRLDFGDDDEYREEEFFVTLSSDSPDLFLTDWWKARTDLFSSKAKAVAIALRDLMLFGTYEFTKLNQILQIRKVSNDSTFSKRSFSWDVLSEEVADKLLDKSAFLYDGTGIPREIA